jgi:hypothetical protein
MNFVGNNDNYLNRIKQHAEEMGNYLKDMQSWEKQVGEILMCYFLIKI